MSKKDKIIDQCFLLFTLWTENPHSEEYQRTTNGLWELLAEYDEDRHTNVFKEALKKSRAGG
jgi:hypothetical protein